MGASPDLLSILDALEKAGLEAILIGGGSVW
jgi:tRNA nucleotidyltransferase/poly(A) polymerase